jgi:hypothetical protein
MATVECVLELVMIKGCTESASCYMLCGVECGFVLKTEISKSCVGTTELRAAHHGHYHLDEAPHHTRLGRGEHCSSLHPPHLFPERPEVKDIHVIVVLCITNIGVDGETDGRRYCCHLDVTHTRSLIETQHKCTLYCCYCSQRQPSTS